MFHSKRSHRDGKPVHCNQRTALLATTRESPRAAVKTRTAKHKYFFKKCKVKIFKFILHIAQHEYTPNTAVHLKMVEMINFVLCILKRPAHRHRIIS